MRSISSKKIVNVFIKISVKKYKKEEFLESMFTYRANISKQPGCMSFEVYQNADEDNSCQLLSEWESVQAMEKHFKTHEFELLLGASKVLGNNFEIETNKVLNTGDLDWARRKIKSIQV